MSKRRVVVTGLSMLSPVGADLDTSWKNILNGKSGIKPIEDFDTTAFPVNFAGWVDGFDPLKYFTPKDLKKMDICLQYGIAAGMDAFADSGLEVNAENAPRVGVSIGSGIGGLSTMQENLAQLLEVGPRRVSPFFIPSTIINMISGHVAIKIGAKGPNIAIVTACTTGTHNIGNAYRLIQYGDADVMLAGGAEKASCAPGVAGFASARALSRRNDEPEKASRPWDKGRDGFVLGDGAGVVVLEEYEHAKARGAKIYAELIGYGMSDDAYHMTLPSGDGCYLSMANAVKDAGIDAADIDYINAHATSTQAGDIVESDGIKKLMGSAVDKVSISSTKSMIGHLLGAAGAVESIFSILALRDQIAPPTINLDDPDEGCDLDYVAHEAKPREINVSLNNSFGFGGTNGTLIFKRP